MTTPAPEPQEPQETFYNELEEAAQVFKQQRDARERIPGCVVALFLAFFAALFFLLPGLVWNEACEFYHFHDCEQAAMGQVVSCQKTGHKTSTVSLRYRAADGSERLLEQETRQPQLYPAGASVKVRYKDGHAFIDNGKEDKSRNLLTIIFLPIFWVLAYVILSALLPGFTRKLWRKRKHN